MAQDVSDGPPKRNGAVAAYVVVVLLAALIIARQLVHPAWETRHDSYQLLPVQEWGFGVGYWDGVNPTTRQGVSGRIYGCGFIERSTNTQ